MNKLCFQYLFFSYWLKVRQWIVPLYTHMDTLHRSQWQVTAPYTDLSDNLWPPTQISVTSYGPPTQNSVTSYGPPTLISVTIGTRILKLKLKIRVKIKFFRIFTMFIVILRSFYIIYVEISCHLIVPLTPSLELTMKPKYNVRPSQRWGVLHHLVTAGLRVKSVIYWPWADTTQWVGRCWFWIVGSWWYQHAIHTRVGVRRNFCRANIHNWEVSLLLFWSNFNWNSLRYGKMILCRL